MTASDDTRRELHNRELRTRLAATKFVPCYIGRGKAVHAAVSTTKNVNGFEFPRPLCQPHSSTFFATTVPQDTEVTCKRCLAALAPRLEELERNRQRTQNSTESSGASSPSTDREARKEAAARREAETPVPTTPLGARGTLLLVTTAHPSLFEHTLDGELHPNLGRLIQPRHMSSIERTAAAGIPWAADNDCFQGLDEAAYIRLLDRIQGLPGCLFVTVPDVVGDADETLRLFDHWIGELEARGLPAALVAQDGLEDRVDDIRWEQIDALFIGGSTEWKEGPAAAELAQLAASKGKWVHWGRVNTKRRFDLIVATGAASSFDGSKFARFRKTYLDQGLTWARSTKPASYGYTVPEDYSVADLSRAADNRFRRYERVRFERDNGGRKTVILREPVITRIAGHDCLTGLEVDRFGEEITPAAGAATERRYLIELPLILKRTPLVWDNHYAELKEES